jgi:hypothetical protein
MAQRVEAPDSLDYFPTPPWAVRAVCVHALGNEDRVLNPDERALNGSAWDPGCGEGHMVHGLEDFFYPVFGSDVFDYGKGFPVGDFLDETLGTFWLPPEPVDWIFFNPPFVRAKEFLLKALALRPRCGVAMLVRMGWLETEERYLEIFNGPLRPDEIWISADRIPMVKARYDPDARSATGYAWLVWRWPAATAAELSGTFRNDRHSTLTDWIPYGCKPRFFHPSDLLVAPLEREDPAAADQSDMFREASR